MQGEGVCAESVELTQEIGYGADIVGSLNILSNIYFNEKDYVNCLNSAREAIAPTLRMPT
jgi:hypothetical protein